MNLLALRAWVVSLGVLSALLLTGLSPATAADVKKWGWGRIGGTPSVGCPRNTQNIWSQMEYVV